MMDGSRILYIHLVWLVCVENKINANLKTAVTEQNVQWTNFSTFPVIFPEGNKELFTGVMYFPHEFSASICGILYGFISHGPSVLNAFSNFPHLSIVSFPISMIQKLAIKLALANGLSGSDVFRSHTCICAIWLGHYAPLKRTFFRWLLTKR